MEETVPFGKYKGRPYMDMVADTQYYSWLKQQPWFRDNFGTKVSHQVEAAFSPYKDQPTPQHNRLQNRFLDEDKGKTFLQNIGLGMRAENYNVQFEWDFGWDVLVCGCAVELKTIMGDDYPCVLRKMAQQIRNTKKMGSFVDYFILIVDRYNGETSWEDIKKIFATRGIRVYNTTIFSNAYPGTMSS